MVILAVHLRLREFRVHQTVTLIAKSATALLMPMTGGLLLFG
jgi:hypothetical protein